MHARSLILGTFALFWVLGPLLADDASDLRYHKDELEDWVDRTDDVEERQRRLIAEIRGLLNFDEEQMENLIDEICSYDIESRDDEWWSRARDMVEDVQREAENRHDDLVGEAESLKNEADYVADQVEDVVGDLEKLEDSEDVGDEAEAARESAQKVWSRLKRSFGELAKNQQQLAKAAAGVFLGANNPKVRASLLHGIEQHKEAQSDFDCDETEYPAGGGRADCIVFDECRVYEFKPYGREGNAAAQLDRYIPSIRQDFAGRPEVEHCEVDASDGLPIFEGIVMGYNAETPCS